MSMKHGDKALELAEQSAQLNRLTGTVVRGPNNSTFMVPRSAVPILSSELPPPLTPDLKMVLNNYIDVSIPEYPQIMRAALSVCTVAVGTYTDSNGTYNAMVHLLPHGFALSTPDYGCEGTMCTHKQFEIWRRLNLTRRHILDKDTKSFYLSSMLSIFSGTNWDVTVVSPDRDKDFDPIEVAEPGGITAQDVAQQLIEQGHNESSVRVFVGRGIRVDPDGTMSFRV